MKRLTILSAIPIAFALVLPAFAGGGRGRYNNTPAMTADGPVFNPTMTPEWRQGGGTIEGYQAIMQQKMMVQQQKEYDAYQKQVNAYLKANPQVKKQLEERQKQAQRQMLASPARKKKKTTTAKRSETDKAVGSVEAAKAVAVAGAPAARPPLSASRAKNQ